MTALAAHLTDAWCNSVHRRINFTKRRRTKDAKTLPENFIQLKDGLLQRVTKAIVEHNIPPELVINMDETGLACSGPSLKLEKESKDVSITGIDDNCKLTMVVSCCLKEYCWLPKSCPRGRQLN